MIDLLKYLHKIYRKDKLTLQIMNTTVKQLEQVEKNINEIAEQRDLQSAVWGVNLFEKELNIKGNGKALEQRKSVIKAKWRGTGKLTLLLIQMTLQSYITGDISVVFQKRLYITMQSKIIEAINMQDIINSIEEIKPAHIGWGLNYILPDFETNINIGSMVQAAVLIEVFPDVPSELESEINIISAAKAYAGIYLEVKEE